MRTRNDRLRHAGGFIVIGLLIAAPLASWATGIHLNQMGPMAMFFSLLATVWIYVYSVGIDKLLLKYQNHTHKSLWQRVVIAAGYECGLLLAAMPIMSLWLGITLWEAFLLDLGFVTFYLIYAFGYNLAYDKVFPIPRYVPQAT